MTWFALPLLVPICIWAMHFVSHPTHSAHLKAPDLIGTYRAQTSEGTQTLVLEKNGNLQNVLVLNGGYTYRQKTGSWKLFRKPNGEQLIELRGLLYYGNGHPGVYGGGYPIDDVGGRLVIYSADGEIRKAVIAPTKTGSMLK